MWEGRRKVWKTRAVECYKTKHGVKPNGHVTDTDGFMVVLAFVSIKTTSRLETTCLGSLIIAIILSIIAPLLNCHDRSSKN